MKYYYYWLISSLTLVLYLLLLLFFSFRKEDVLGLLQASRQNVKPKHDSIITSNHTIEDESLILESRLPSYHIPQSSTVALAKTIRGYRLDLESHPFLGWYYDLIKDDPLPPSRDRSGVLPPFPTYDQFMDPSCPPNFFRPLDEPLAQFLNAKQFTTQQSDYCKLVFDGNENTTDPEIYKQVTNSLECFLVRATLTIGQFRLWFFKQPIMYTTIQTPLPTYENWLNMDDYEQTNFFYGEPSNVTTYLNNKPHVLNNPYFIKVLNDQSPVPDLYYNPTRLFIARLKRLRIHLRNLIPDVMKDIIESDDDDNEDDDNNEAL